MPLVCSYFDIIFVLPLSIQSLLTSMYLVCVGCESVNDLTHSFSNKIKKNDAQFAVKVWPISVPSV